MAEAPADTKLQIGGLLGAFSQKAMSAENAMESMADLNQALYKAVEANTPEIDKSALNEKWKIIYNYAENSEENLKTAMNSYAQNVQLAAPILAALPEEQRNTLLATIAKSVGIEPEQAQEINPAPDEKKTTKEDKGAAKINEEAKDATLTINGIKFTRIGDGDVIKMERSETDPETGITTSKSAYIGAEKGQAGEMWDKLKGLDKQENDTDISRDAIRKKLDDIMPMDATTDPLIYNGMPKNDGDAISRWQNLKPDFFEKGPYKQPVARVELLPMIRDELPPRALDGFKLPESMGFKPEPTIVGGLLREPPIYIMSDGTTRESPTRDDRAVIEELKSLTPEQLDKYTVPALAHETDTKKSVPTDLAAIARSNEGRG